MIALQSRVDETHKAVTERMGRLEAMLAQQLTLHSPHVMQVPEILSM